MTVLVVYSKLKVFRIFTVVISEANIIKICVLKYVPSTGENLNHIKNTLKTTIDAKKLIHVLGVKP